MTAQDENKTYVDGVEINMGMTLGTQSTYPLAMASAYATFASGGVYCEPIAITSVSRDGEELPIPQANCRQVLETATANAVNYALEQVIGPNGGAKYASLAGHTAAGKTGTTQNNSNVWFTGYTPALSTSMWMGHPDNQNIVLRNVTIAGVPYSIVWGSTIAAPTWKTYMDQALAGTPDIGFGAVSQAQIGRAPVVVVPKTVTPTVPEESTEPAVPNEQSTDGGQNDGRNDR